MSSQEKKFMKLALTEAAKAYQSGNYPCGAVLVVNGKVTGKAHNLKELKKDRISHAEMLLYIKYSQFLKKSKKENAVVTMYTTLEPCLMCFGAAAIHRVDRIVVSSPDPEGNMSHIKGEDLGNFYKANLPKIEYGVLFEETLEITEKYLVEKGDKDSLKLIKSFNEMRNKF